MSVKNRDFFVLDNLFVLRGMDSHSVDLIYLDPPFNTEKEQSSAINKKNKQAILSFFRYAKEEGLDLGIPLEWKEEYTSPAFKDRWDSKEDQERGTIFQKNVAVSSPNVNSYLDFIKQHLSPSIYNYLAFMAVRLIEMKRILKPTGSLYIHCDSKANYYLRQLMDLVFDKDNFRNEILWCYSNIGRAPIRNYPQKHDTILLYSKGHKNYFVQQNVVHHLSKASEPAPDWWIDIVSFNGFMKPKDDSHCGYPTQKPLALLERIIETSCPEDGVVLDPFAGCATTCIAVERLNFSKKRNCKWIGIDTLAISYVLNIYRLVNEIWKGKDKALPIGEVLPRLRREPPLSIKNYDEEDRKRADHIYVIENPSYQNKYKIGITTDIQLRLKTFQTYDPYKKFKEVFCKRVGIQKARELEEKTINEFHRLYGGSIEKNGEWVTADSHEEIIAYILQ